MPILVQFQMVSQLRVSVLIILAASLVVGCQSKAKEAEAEAPVVAVETATAELRAINETISATGSFEPTQGNEARLAPPVAGKIVKVFVKEGEHVVAGQLVALMDIKVLQAQAASAVSASTAASAQATEADLSSKAAEADQVAQLQSALQSLASAKLQRDSDVVQAKANFEVAEAEYQRVRSGGRPEEVEQAKSTLRQAEVNRDQAKRNADRQSKLLEEGYISKQEAESAAQSLEIAKEAVKSAQSALEIVQKPRLEDLKSAQLKLDSAREALRSARTIGDSKVALAQTAVQQARLAKLSVEARRQNAIAMRRTAAQKMADAQAAIGSKQNGEIRSPISGIVAKRFMNPGDVADIVNPIVEIQNNEKGVDLVANIVSTDGAKVEVGMSTRIVMNESQTDDLRGFVLSIGEVDATNGLIPVRIHVQGNAKGVRTGSAAVAKIVTESYPKSVAVPKETVLEREGKPVVFVVSDGVAKMVEVKTGPTENGWTRIVSGLTEGQKVVKLGHYELADGTKVSEK